MPRKKSVKKKVAKQPVRQKKIIRPSDLPWPDDWDIINIGLSQSLIYQWKTCKRRFLFILNGYRNPAKDISTNFGSICHEVMDKVFSNNTPPGNKGVVNIIDRYCDKKLKDGTGVSLQQMEVDAAKAEATMIPYFEFYKDDFKTKKYFDVESLFQARYSGATIRGKIDAKYRTKNGKKWLKEHKTKGQIDEDGLLKYLPLDFQNQFYLTADRYMTGELAIGVLYNVVRNSRARPLKNETLMAFKKKVMNECRKNPEHFYKRWESTYSEHDLEIFGRDLGFVFDEIKFKNKMHVWPNTWACLNPWRCEFLSACSSDSCKSLVQIEGGIHDKLFPELKEDSDGGKKSVSKKKTAERKTAKRVAKKRKA